MGNPLPSTGVDLPCALQNFTGIPAVTAQPAYSVYIYTVHEVELAACQILSTEGIVHEVPSF